MKNLLRIEIIEDDDGFEVVIPDQNGDEFARTWGKSLSEAVTAATSYIACVFDDLNNPDCVTKVQRNDSIAVEPIWVRSEKVEQGGTDA